MRGKGGIKHMEHMEQKKILHLKNKAMGAFTLQIRRGHLGDEKGMIACIREEYGDTYFKRDFYHKDYLKKEAVKGHITFLVAEDSDKKIVGMMILKEFYPEESMCEIATQIIRKQYRGCGLAMPFFEYGMDILKSRSYSAAYCLPVLFHDITQRLLYRLGLRATGMILNVFDMDKITTSYKKGQNQKHSQGIQVMALKKKNAGILYIPKEHKAFAANMYDRLGVQYQICTEEKEEVLPTGGNLEYSQDEVQSNLEVRIQSVGADSIKRLELLMTTYPLKKKQTCNVFLNINDPHAVTAYHILKKKGYFFTGLKSLCSEEQEYMVLHHPGTITIYMNEFVLSSEIIILKNYVENCYRELYGSRGGD